MIRSGETTRHEVVVSVPYKGANIWLTTRGQFDGDHRIELSVDYTAETALEARQAVRSRLIALRDALNEAIES